MNKIYKVLCAGLVLTMLIIGCISLVDRDAVYSDFQGRELVTFPNITFVGLIDGSFYQQLQEYYGDTFPGRERLLEGDSIVSTFFQIRVESEDMDADAEKIR